MDSFSTRFITDINNFDPSSIHWKVISSSIKVGNQTINTQRAIPYVKNSQGDESPLLLQTDKVYTYGVKEAEKQNGQGFDYSLPISMCDMNGPTAYQKKFITLCDKISENAREHLLTIAHTLGKDWIASDLRKLSILWRKDASSDRPTLYAKLPLTKGKFNCSFIQPFLQKKTKQVLTKKVDPLLYRDVGCVVKTVLRIDSVFIGAKPSFQTKAEEVVIFPRAEKVQLVQLNVEDLEGLAEEEDSEEENKTEGEEDDNEYAPAEPSAPTNREEVNVVLPEMVEIPKKPLSGRRRKLSD